MEQRISLITLGVSDLARAIEFYQSILGWHAAPSPPEIAFFNVNGLVFSLFPHADLAEDMGTSEGTTTTYSGCALAHNVRSKEEVDAIFTHLRAKGVTIVKEPQQASWGGYSGYFADPDGHNWEVAYNPYWSIAADGSVSTQ